MTDPKKQTKNETDDTETLEFVGDDVPNPLDAVENSDSALEKRSTDARVHIKKRSSMKEAVEGSEDDSKDEFVFVEEMHNDLKKIEKTVITSEDDSAFVGEESESKDVSDEDSNKSVNTAIEETVDLPDDDSKEEDNDEKPAVISSVSRPSSYSHFSSTSRSDTSVSSVLVSYEDELPDVIDQVESVKTKRVVVSIPEGSDLLVSSVGMRLVASHADKQGKLVVIVTNDPAGRNMARMAGLGVADTTAGVDETVWGDAQNARQLRSDSEKQKGNMKAELGLEDEDLNDQEQKDLGILVNKDFQDNLEVTDRSRDSIPTRSAGARYGGVVASTKESEERESIDMVASAGSIGVSESMLRVSNDRSSVPSRPAQPSIRTVSMGDFEITIDEGKKLGSSTSFNSSSALRSSEGVSSGSTMAEERRNDSAGLVGRDFSDFGKANASEGDLQERVQARQNARTSSSEKGTSFIKTLGATIGGVFAKVPQVGASVTASAGKGVIKTIAKRVIIPFVLIIGLIVAGLYWYLPEVVVSLKVESIALDYSGDITAQKNVDKTEVATLTIPARSETVEKTGSDSTATTGSAVRGEKASGTVMFFNKTGEAIAIPSGTLISNGGLNFVVQGDVSVPACADPPDCIGMGSASKDVIAEAVGEEYNLASGTIFTIQGRDGAVLFGKNLSAFTGGTKTNYQVVSQTDIDGVAEKLKTQLYDQAKLSLQEKLKGTKWVMVESSIKNELNGEVTSDAPAGAEKTSVNVDVKTKSTALYYDGKALSSLIDELLLDDLDSDEAEQIEISDNIEKKVTVKSASVDEGMIVLTVEVSGYAMPRLDQEKVEKDLYGKPWAEGLADLKKLDYVSGDPEVEFYPEWFPSFAKRMPGRDGRITVNVENVVPDEEESEENSDSEGESETAE